MATMEPQILILEDRDGGDWALCRVAYFDELTIKRDELLFKQKQLARVLARMKQAVCDWRDGSDLGAQAITSLVDDWIEQLEDLAPPSCDVCRGTGRTSNHVDGEVECSACEGCGVTIQDAIANADRRCHGRYPVTQTSPARDEPFDVTYRCAMPTGHYGPHGPSQEGK